MFMLYGGGDSGWTWGGVALRVVDSDEWAEAGKWRCGSAAVT